MINILVPQGCFSFLKSISCYDFYMNTKKLIYSVLALLIGIFLVIYGGYDDSPGGQLLGVVIAIIAIVNIVKNKKKVSGPQV